MVGIFYFDHLGILDYSMLYIHPTYITSAIIGGIVMGMGFSLGGYCPGTSYCAVAIGKIDALIFSIGLFLGIFVFSEVYPLIENMYLTKSLGAVKVFESIGISGELFIFLLILAAIGIFIVTRYIQQRVRKVEY
jgi:hypothetical protein